MPTHLRRTIVTLLCVVPMGAAALAAPGAAASDSATAAYDRFELQARTNLLVNDDGYNLPRGSSFSSISPDINATESG